MKNLKLFFTIGLLVTSILKVQANDYALLDTYPLLNDMKILKSKHNVLSDVKKLILTRPNNARENLSEQKQRFSSILNGLSNGNKQLGLQGTQVKILKNQIDAIQRVWSEEHTTLNAALKNSIYQESALNTIDKLSLELQKLHSLYQQSYARYKKNTVMKSLVKSYMRVHVESKPLYALNTIK